MRKFMPALAITAVAVAGVAVPGAAFAATPPVVQWATSDQSDLARLDVNVSAEAGVASIKVHIVDTTTHKNVAVVSDFYQSSGDDATQGIWSTANDVVGIPLGFYQLDVDVTDNDGVKTHQVDAGNLNYAVQMYYVDLNSTPTVTYTNRKFVVSGQLMGRWPGTGVEKLIPHAQVELGTQDGDFVDGTTNANGQFKLVSDVDAADDSAYVTTLYDPSRSNYLQAFAQIAAPTIQQQPVRVTMHLSKTKVLTAGAITITGNLSWKSPTGWQPIPNAYMVVGLCQPQDNPLYCGGGLGNMTTDDQGNYSITVNPYYSGIVDVGTYNADPFVQTNAFSTGVPITVISATSFTNYLAVRNTDDNKVYVQGGLSFAYGSPASAIVNIQYSKTGTGGWHTQAVIDLNSASQPFNQEFAKGSGYWRITYAGVTDSIESAVTPVTFVQ